MDLIQSLFPDELIETIGWTIFHSLWQATLVLILLLVVLFFMKKYSPRIRYFIAFSGLVSIVVISGFTAFKSYSYAKEKVEIKQTLISNPLEVKEILKQKLAAETESKTKANQFISSANTIKLRAFLQRNFPVVFLLWVLGMFYFLIRLLGGIVHLQQIRTRHVTNMESEWILKFEEIKEKLVINKSVEFLQSAMIKVPMLLGYFKPVVLLPVSLMTGLAPNEIEAVIAHELAHLKRHDYLLNIIQSVIEAVFFFHPAVWLISKIIRNEREHSCDDLAVQSTGDKLNYIKALAAAQEISMSTAPNYAVAFSNNKSGLLNRVKRIKNQNTMKNNVTEGFVAASIIFFSLILLSFTIDGENLKHELDSVPTPPEPREVRAEPAPVKPVSRVKPDSINRIIEGKVHEVPEVPEEMEQLMEIAYTYNDEELSDLINQSMELAFKEIEMNEIMSFAMQQADSALSEIDINAIIAEAMEEAKIEIQAEVDSPEIALEAMEIAKSTMEAIDIGEIIEMAMQEAAIAIEAIDMEEIMQEAMAEAEEAKEASEDEMRAAMYEAQEAMKEAQEAMKESQKMQFESQQKLTEEEKARIKEELKHAQIEIEKQRIELEKMAKEMQRDARESAQEAERESERESRSSRESERSRKSSQSEEEKMSDLENQLKELEDEK